MTDNSTEGKQSRTLQWLSLHWRLLTVPVLGALGALINHSLQDPGPGSSFVWAALSGAAASYVFVILVANTDRRNLKRLFAVALVAGFAHIPVWHSARKALGLGDSPSSAPTVATLPAESQKELLCPKLEQRWQNLLAARNDVDERASPAMTTTQEPATPAVDCESTGIDTLPRHRYTEEVTRALVVRDTVLREFASYADHWYRVNIPSDGDYVVQTLPTDAGMVDTEVIVFDAEFGELGTDDDCGYVILSKLPLRLNAGEYFVRVSSYNQTPGPYRLVVSRGQDAVPDCRPGVLDIDIDDFSTEPPDWSLARTVTVGGETEASFDVHLYRFAVEEPGEYIVSTNGSDRGPDTLIQLYDSDENSIVAYDDDGGDGHYSLLQRHLEAGTFYIEVSTLGLGGPYSLSVSATTGDSANASAVRMR